MRSLKLFDARGIGVRGKELPQFQRASVVQKQVLAGKTCALLNTTARFWAYPQVLRPNRAVEVPRHQRQSFATKCINTPETTMPATCNIPSHSPAKISTEFECSRVLTVIKSAADAVQIWYLWLSSQDSARNLRGKVENEEGGGMGQNIRCDDEKWGVEETDGGDAGWRGRGVNVWWR